jgi:hypothetical protein
VVVIQTTNHEGESDTDGVGDNRDDDYEDDDERGGGGEEEEEEEEVEVEVEVEKGYDCEAAQPYLHCSPAPIDAVGDHGGDSGRARSRRFSAEH